MLSREVLGRTGPDYFLANPPRQPKKEIGDYVESQGILVPRRFETLADALSSGKPFIARSEHPQDYAGVSGLLHSPKFEPRYVTQEEIRDSLKEVFWKVDSYCRFTGISQQEFLSGVSYSYWELLPGYNRTIIADSAIPNRYHVITTRSAEDLSLGYGYTIVENGEVKVDSSWRLPSDLFTSIPSLVKLYESIRNLKRFDRNHCPIIETQTVEETPYFLQYHRGTDSKPSTFVLDREREEGEMQASYIRGATSKDGVILRLNVHTIYDKTREVRVEDAGLDWQTPMYRQIMARKRRLQVVEFDYIGDVSRFIAGRVDPHLTISELFKPPLSLAISKRMDRDWLVRGFYGSEEEPVNQFNIRVVSDGRKAYIKRLG